MDTRLIAMRRNETLTRKGGITRVECAEGALWVTGEGLADDLILMANEGRDVSGMRRLCIQALRDAKLRVVEG